MYNFKNKGSVIASSSNYLLSKTMSMFEYTGLPDTINPKQLEKILQVNGYAFITKIDGKLYATIGGLGGEPDVYGDPTKINVSIPALKFSKTLDIKGDGVLICSDSTKMGLKPLFDRSCFMLAENDINFVLQGYDTRMNKLISASDDKTKDSAEKFISKVVEGEISIISENAIFDGVRMQSADSHSSSYMDSLIKFSQYIKASLYNELGLSSNVNLQRTQILEVEVEQNEELIFPLIYNMFQCRQVGVESVNDKYGLDVGVCFGSIWGLKYGKTFSRGVKKMLLSEYMGTDGIWAQIDAYATKKGIALPFLSGYNLNSLDKQTVLRYGDREMFTKYVDVSKDDMAELILMEYSQKWTDVSLLSKVSALGNETITTVNSKSGTSTTTKENTNVNKVSAYNSETLIADSGNTDSGNVSKVDELDNTSTVSKVKFSDVIENLTNAEKLSVVNIVVKDVVGFMTNSTY